MKATLVCLINKYLSHFHDDVVRRPYERTCIDGMRLFLVPELQVPVGNDSLPSYRGHLLYEEWLFLSS